MAKFAPPPILLAKLCLWHSVW